MKKLKEHYEEGEAIRWEEVQKDMKPRRISGTLVFTGIVVLVLLAAVSFAWIQGEAHAAAGAQAQIDELRKEIQELSEENQQLREEPIVVNPVSPVIVLDNILTEIKEIGELATVEYYYTNAGRFTDAIPLLEKYSVPLTTKSFTMKWDGVIKVGISIDRISISVNEEEKIISIYLPKATILSHELDEKSFEVLDEKDGLFNPVRLEDQTKFNAANKAEMEKRAEENGVFLKAQKNAQEIIKKLILANPDIAENYTVKFV